MTFTDSSTSRETGMELEKGAQNLKKKPISKPLFEYQGQWVCAVCGKSCGNINLQKLAPRTFIEFEKLLSIDFRVMLEHARQKSPTIADTICLIATFFWIIGQDYSLSATQIAKAQGVLRKTITRWTDEWNNHSFV